MTVAGRHIEIEGRRHLVQIQGAGRPAVVLEPAIADIGLTWALVQPEIARSTTVFTHDRPGLGGSDPSRLPRTADVMVAELRTALGASDLAPPYVLVGHSFASLTVRAFAHRHPQEVAGILLVDGAHEDQMERFPPELDAGPMLAATAAQLRRLADSARRGEEVPELVRPPAAFSTGLADAYRRAMRPTPVRLEAAAAEYESLAESQQQVRGLAPSPLGAVPLIALRHGIPQAMPHVPADLNERYEATWQELQSELAARSSRGRVVVAQDAGHMIHHDRPDLVVGCIRELVETAV